MLPVQLACRQPVLLDQARQAPEPSQVPSLVQMPPPALVWAQRDLGSEPPLSTLEQVPA